MEGNNDNEGDHNLNEEIPAPSVTNKTRTTPDKRESA